MLPLARLFSRPSPEFRVRSSDRDQQGDQDMVAPVARALDNALQAADTEYTGLSRRLEEARARASIVAGAGSDEYLSREGSDANWLRELEAEMQSAQARLNLLQQNISHLKFVRAALLTRFPQLSRSEQPPPTV